MKRFFLTIILSFSFIVDTQAQNSDIKSWQTFTSDFGFTFKYPDCWTISPDDPDESDIPITEAHDLYIAESKSCMGNPLNPPRPNSVGFIVERGKVMSKDVVLKKLDQLERQSGDTIARKYWLYFKRLQVNGLQAYVDVKFEREIGFTYMYWELTLYCPERKITYTGPRVKNPDQFYFDRFKAGDMAMPEPEKTIFESIRCSKVKKHDD